MLQIPTFDVSFLMIWKCELSLYVVVVLKWSKSLAWGTNLTQIVPSKQDSVGRNMLYTSLSLKHSFIFVFSLFLSHTYTFYVFLSLFLSLAIYNSIYQSIYLNIYIYLSRKIEASINVHSCIYLYLPLFIKDFFSSSFFSVLVY